KLLKQRLHICPYCNIEIDRDIASSLILKQRGKTAVGQPIGYQEIACGGRGAGVLQFTLFDLVTA
ncbi:MAG: transposase, partial [Xenococcaceae cyanobacterium MO_207.B15]|nr:transposase [Xenococcaceae cyanobacterium MO_207.B15]